PATQSLWDDLQAGQPLLGPGSRPFEIADLAFLSGNPYMGYRSNQWKGTTKGMSEFSNELETEVNTQVNELSEANATLQEQIAERKGAEERLSESEEHYRNVAETATDAIITSDEEGIITFVNRAAERVFGYASEDLFGLKIMMLMPEYLRH